MSKSLTVLGGERLRGIKKRPQSPKDLAKRSIKMKERWAQNREAMIAKLPRGEKHHWKKPPQERRHRLHFSALQRKEWKDDKCVWCDSPDHLVLDHILPIAIGGTNVRANAQTLCQPCNLWKMWYVDRHLCLAVKATSWGLT